MEKSFFAPIPKLNLTFTNELEAAWLTLIYIYFFLYIQSCDEEHQIESMSLIENE